MQRILRDIEILINNENHSNNNILNFYRGEDNEKSFIATIRSNNHVADNIAMNQQNIVMTGAYHDMVNEHNDEKPGKSSIVVSFADNEFNYNINNTSNNTPMEKKLLCYLNPFCDLHT